MGEVWDAVQKATLGKKYSEEYNCNIWCDKVMSYFGWVVIHIGIVSV